MIDGYHCINTPSLNDISISSEDLTTTITNILNDLAVSMDYISHIQPCACFKCEAVYGKDKK